MTPASTSSALRAMARGTPARRAVSRMRATKKRSLTTARTGRYWPEPGDGPATAWGESGAMSGPPMFRIWGAISGPLMSSIALLADAEPVPLPLGNVGEGRQVAHTIEVHVPVEMIGLVLGDACEEVLGIDDVARAFTVVKLEPDRRVAGHDAPHVGNRQAALPAVFHLVCQRRDDGIDDHGERDLGRVGIARIGLDLDDRDLLEDVDLVGGESGPVVLAHRLDQVVDELLGLGGQNFFRGERSCRLSQDRMPESGDLQNGHDPRNCSTQI